LLANKVKAVLASQKNSKGLEGQQKCKINGFPNNFQGFVLGRRIAVFWDRDFKIIWQKGLTEMNVSFSCRFDGVEGSEIRKIFSLLSDPDMISFAGGNPSPLSFPSKEIGEIAAELIKNQASTIFQYGNTLGTGELIETVREMNKGIMRESDGVIILTGSSQGIEMTARALIDRGDALLVESPSFLGALQTFKLAQADVKSVRLTEDGTDLNELEDKIKKYAPKFFYVIPTFQNPTGITTSAKKRKSIYEICAKHGVIILEDDPYAELRYEGEAIAPIKTYDTEGTVIRLASFSKTISPGLRVGAAIADKRIIHKFNLAKQGMDVHTSNLSQYIVSEYVRRGYYQPHVLEICSLYRAQRDEMERAIAENFPKDVSVLHPAGGLFMWGALPEGICAKDLFALCAAKKVAFVPGAPFYAEDPKVNTFRLNFSMPSRENIRKGIRIMGDTLKGEFLNK
jgi:2-aminoadipate transaminase